MKCRKCGTANDEGAWVCRRCEYILDPSFLGNDILNERTRDSLADDADDAGDDADELLPGEAPSGGEDVEGDALGGDALILGKLDDDDVASFVSDRTGGFLPASTSKAPAQVYVTGEVSRLLLPGRVLRHTADAAERREVLSVFEAAVFDVIDGKRTLEEVQDRAGLTDNELCVTVAMLWDKALIEAADGAPALPRVDELDDATNPLQDLPPLEAPAPADAPPLPFDALFPLPEPEGPSTAAVREVAVPVTPDVRPAPALRPALRPAMKAPGPTPRSQQAKPSPASPASPASPVNAPGESARPASTSTAEAKRRAAGYYEACMKDLRAGRAGRAWSYAKMAADADPHEEKYQELLRDWSKHAAGHGDRPSTPQELMAAAQDAEASGDVDKAVALLQQLLEAAPSSAAAHNKLAVILATKLKQFRSAYDHAIRAVELEPGNMAFQSNMMKILARVDSDDKKAKDDDKGLLGRLLRR